MQWKSNLKKAKRVLLGDPDLPPMLSPVFVLGSGAFIIKVLD